MKDCKLNLRYCQRSLPHRILQKFRACPVNKNKNEDGLVRAKRYICMCLENSQAKMNCVDCVRLEKKNTVAAEGTVHG